VLRKFGGWKSDQLASLSQEAESPASSRRKTMRGGMLDYKSQQMEAGKLDASRGFVLSKALEAKTGRKK